MIKKLMTYEEAKHTVEANFKPVFLGEEEAVLLEAYNRVLAADVASPIDIPAFNTSHFSGYAVKAADTATATEDEPIALKVIGCVGAGETCKTAVSVGEAVEVASGAVLPEGADAVIAFEDAEREDDSLHVFAAITAGEGIHKQGSDVRKDATVLEKGQLLGAAEVGVLAALGLKQVKVLKYPMVAVLSVGSQTSELGKPLSPGSAYDLNSYCLCTAVMECGAKAVYFGVAPDDKAAVARLLRAAVASSDLVVASSSIDVAEVADALSKPGLVVNGVAVKPGKQTAVAFVDDKPVFLLPADPSAALLMFQLFARSLVQRLGGRPVAGLRAVSAFAGSKMFGAKGSRAFVLVKLMFDEDCRLIAEPIGSADAVSGLAEADGFVQIAENEQFVEVNQEVTVTLLRGLAGRA